MHVKTHVHTSEHFLYWIHDRLQLHGAIYHPDSFVLMLRYCANLKAIRYESTTLNRIVADQSHCVIIAIADKYAHLAHVSRVIHLFSKRVCSLARFIETIRHRK